MDYRQASIDEPGVLFTTGTETSNYLPKGYFKGEIVELSFVFSPPMWRYVGDHKGWLFASEIKEQR